MCNANKIFGNIHIEYSICGFFQAKSRIHVDKNDLSRICLLHSKRIIPGGITMVLAHRFESHIIYLISSKNTIGSCVVLTHGIGKG